MLRSRVLNRFFLDPNARALLDRLLKQKNSSPSAKNRTKEMLQHEMQHNPYYNQAFPEVSKIVIATEKKKPPNNWVESLLERYIPPKQEEPFRTEEHIKTFIEGFRTPQGPIKWLSDEEKEKVHLLIDAKMSQLEETGLSREELLFNRPGGIPLAFDPVFQFLKQNRAAREIVVKPGAEFTVDSVIDPALHQDFGIDRVKALPNKKEKYSHELTSSYQNSVIAKMRKPDKIEPSDYFWRANLQGKLRVLRMYGEASRVLFPRPLALKSQIRRKDLRSVNTADISFRNPALLSKFMAFTGKIRNRYVTKLPSNLQRKVSWAIKHAKNLNIFPFVAMIQPFHTVSLVGAHHTANQLCIHAQTGIVFSNSKAEQLKENNKPEKETFMRLLVEKYKSERTEEDLFANFNRQQSITNFKFRSAEFLTSAELDLLEALNFPKDSPAKGSPEGKKAFEQVKGKIEGSTLCTNELTEWFLQERAASTDLFTDKSKPSEPGDVMALLQDLNKAKKSFGLKPCPTSVVHPLEFHNRT